jgi:hypothetical protein
VPNPNPNGPCPTWAGLGWRPTHTYSNKEDGGSVSSQLGRQQPIQVLGIDEIDMTWVGRSNRCWSDCYKKLVWLLEAAKLPPCPGACILNAISIHLCMHEQSRYAMQPCRPSSTQAATLQQQPYAHMQAIQSIENMSEYQVHALGVYILCSNFLKLCTARYM